MSKPFATNQIRLNLVDILQTGVDPTAGGGVAAAIGSMFLRSGTAGLYLKTGAGNTAWQLLSQSLNWYSVKDYGAIGNDSADDTASIQAAITAANAAGGGVVFFPPGTYRVTQLTMNGTAKVQLKGSGAGTVIKWNFNAATVAGSMLTVSNAAQKLLIEQIRFDGSLLTNPAASRDNHLLRVGDGTTAVTEVDIRQCTFGAMVAASGDGIHAVGANASRVSRLRISDCLFDGCSRFSVGVEQGVDYFWLLSSYLTNCETEIAYVATADVNSQGAIILGNEINHTGAVRHAIRLEGGATTLITKLILAQNIIFGGFTTLSNAQYVVANGNVQTSGGFASADSVLRIFGNVIDATVVGNFIDRSVGATAGYMFSIERSGGVSPTGINVAANLLVNEISGGGFGQVIDCTFWTVSNNLGRNTVSAGASTAYGYEVQAVAVATTDCKIGPGNQVSAAAGSYAGAVHLLCNGVNVNDISVVGNQANQIDYGLVMEVGGGGGAFGGQLLYSGNNFNGSVGDVNRIGTTVPIRIGTNAGVFGQNLWSGSGSPETVVTARVGSLYLNTAGGQATAVWYKETGTGATGWIGIGGSIGVLFGTSNTTVVSTPAVYMGPGYLLTSTTTEIQYNITRPGTIRNLRINVVGVGTGAATVTYTVRKNGVDTALLATIANTANGGTNDLVHSFTVAAGDLLSVSIAKDAIVAAGQTNVIATAELV